MSPGRGFEHLRRALLPLHLTPAGRGWNHVELLDLLPSAQRLRPAAVLVGLIDRGQGMHVLLTRRTQAMRQHAGQVSFPGGAIEDADGDPVIAALREAGEEIGLRSDQVQPLGYLDPLDTITGFHVYPVVAHIEPDFVALADPTEVDEVFELPFEFLMDPMQERQFQIDYQGRKRSLVEFRHGEHRVWGATAAMLVNLRQRLQEHA